jgi:hypothetical protein
MSHDLWLQYSNNCAKELLPDILPVVIAFVAIYKGSLLSVLVMNLPYPYYSKVRST